VSFQDHNDQDGSHYELTDKEIEEARQYTLKVQHLPTDQTLRPRQSPTRKRKASKAPKPKASTTKARPKAKDFFEDPPPTTPRCPTASTPANPPRVTKRTTTRTTTTTGTRGQAHRNWSWFPAGTRAHHPRRFPASSNSWNRGK
jgi:hypothetical protein